VAFAHVDFCADGVKLGRITGQVLGHHDLVLLDDRLVVEMRLGRFVGTGNPVVEGRVVPAAPAAVAAGHFHNDR